MSSKTQGLISRLPSNYFTKGDISIFKEYATKGDYSTGKGIRVGRPTVAKNTHYTTRSVRTALRKAKLCGFMKQTKPHDMSDPYCKSATYEWDFEVLQKIISGSAEIPLKQLTPRKKSREIESYETREIKVSKPVESREIGSTKSREIDDPLINIYMDNKINKYTDTHFVDNVEKQPNVLSCDACVITQEKDEEHLNKIVDNLSQGPAIKFSYVPKKNLETKSKSEFETFWDNCERKGDLEQTKIQYAKALEEDTPMNLLFKLKAYNRQNKDLKTEFMFIKTSHKWLSDRFWERYYGKYEVDQSSFYEAFSGFKHWLDTEPRAIKAPRQKADAFFKDIRRALAA